MANALARMLASLVVPPLCVCCREPELSGSAVCPRCARLLVPLPSPRCRRCGAPVGRECDRCGECRGRSLAFDHAWSAFAYEGVSRRLVAALKSRGALAAAGFMGARIAQRAPEPLLRGVLVPVPAHPLRRRRHGFNQAAELARALGRAAGLPVTDVLRREAASRAQVGLERRDRLANAPGTVGVRGGSSRRPVVAPFVVLVDDVYTTGATLDACAQALRAAGAREVVALTFARALANARVGRSMGADPRKRRHKGGLPKVRIEIKGRNAVVTEALRKHIENEFRKVSKQVSEFARLEVELLVERNPSIADGKVAEATLHLKGVTLRASEGSSDLTHSVDLVAEKLARQVKRHRDKRRSRRAGTKGIPRSAEAAS